jgi:hypothetical protein
MSVIRAMGLGGGHVGQSGAGGGMKLKVLTVVGN